jgi:membrane fusion protein (multidrug efflux system)
VLFQQNNKKQIYNMNKVLLCIALTSGLLLSSCIKKETPLAGPVPVNLITVKSKPVLYYDRYTSTTVALNQVNLLAQVQGYITGIFFKEGTQVKKGQKLYEIDRRIYEGNYNVAQANFKVAEGNLKQAQQDADRYSLLITKKAVAKQVYDHAIIALENAKNEYNSALELVKNAKTNLAYSVITAPFDGTIGFSQVKMGDLMNVGQTVLNTVSSDDPMAVDFLINEKQLSFFQNLQTEKKSVDSLFTIMLPNNSLYSFTGKISVIDRAVDSQTGSVRIRLVFPNPKRALLAGMSCVVRVHNQESTPQMVIPNRAVVEKMGEFFVFTAKDTVMLNKGDTTKLNTKAKMEHGLFAIQKKVDLGVTIGSDVIIKKGINNGENVIVDGIQSLHNGSAITLLNNKDKGKAKTKDSGKE